MTITSTATRESYVGNGISTSFTVPFPFFGPDELRVYATDAAGVQTTLVRGTSYTVAGGNGGTGTVTTTSALAAGVTLTNVRSTTPTQQVGFANGDPLPGPTVERTLDRLTAGWQEVLASQARSLRVPEGEAALPPTLPAKAVRAGKPLVFDANGDPTVSTPAAGTASISAAMLPVVGMATLAAARTALGTRQHVNAVRDFGASNSGTIDATAAVQAAINSLTVGTVYLEPGAYLVGDITMKPGVALVGDDPLLCTLVARANGVKILKYSAAALVNGIIVRRIGFSGGGYSSVYGMHLDGTDAAKRISLVTLEDLYFAQCDRALNVKFLTSARFDDVRCNICAVGIYIDQCTDVKIDGGWCQNGSGEGIYIIGGAGATDEGIAITGWSSNGQHRGISVVDQDWGQITGCSITTCPGGVLSFLNVTGWQVTGSQISVAGGSPAYPGVTCDLNCSGLQFTNNIVALNTFGFNLLGTRHVVVGNYMTGNSDADISIAATSSIVSGNICHSTGVVQSIAEQVGGDYNVISGNVCNGTVSTAGANTAVNGNNVVY